MELVKGFEPSVFRLQGDCTSRCATPAYSGKRRTISVPNFPYKFNTCLAYKISLIIQYARLVVKLSFNIFVMDNAYITATTQTAYPLINSDII